MGCFMFRLFDKQLLKEALYGYGGFLAFPLKKIKNIFKLRSQLYKNGYSVTMCIEALEKVILELSKKQILVSIPFSV